jgi:hypothetical protein
MRRPTGVNGAAPPGLILARATGVDFRLAPPGLILRPTTNAASCRCPITGRTRVRGADKTKQLCEEIRGSTRRRALARNVLSCARMTAPRQVVPGRFLFVTRTCTQRQFLLRPDDATNNAFVYCLAEAAQRFKIDIVLSQMMSNHLLCAAAHNRCYGERLVMRS